MREHRKFSTGRMSLSSSSPLTSSSSVPSLVQDQHRWTVYMSQVNLPAALNDPRLARRETDFFSKTWGESFERAEVVPSSYVPHITKEHFQKYLKKMAVSFYQSWICTTFFCFFCFFYCYSLCYLKSLGGTSGDQRTMWDISSETGARLVVYLTSIVTRASNICFP